MSSDACVSYAAPGFVVLPRGRTLLARPFDAGALKFTGEAVPIADDVATYSGGELSAFAVSDGGTLAYRRSAQAEGIRSLVWFDRNGRASDPIGAPIESVTGVLIRLSPNDKQVVFSTTSEGARDDIWTYDLERNVRLRLTNDPDIDHVPVWSPDGSKIAFDSHRGGGRGSTIYEVLANGAVAEKVLLKGDGTNFIAASDWSRDGNTLLFQKSPTGSAPWAIWVLPLVGERQPFHYRGGSADAFAARLSPNGHWLAYSTNESGTYQVVVQPFPDPSGGKWQVSDKGGSSPKWRRDGRELYYVAPTGELVAVSVTADSTFVLGKSTTLFRTPLASQTSSLSFEPTADGQRFLVALPPTNAMPPVTTILNWTSLITKTDR